MRRIANIIFAIALLLIVGSQLKQKYYAKSYYPNGNTYRVSIFIPFKNVFRVNQFYETGELQRLYYMNKTGDYQLGEGKIFDKKGNLLALSFLDTDEMYFQRGYDYDLDNRLKETWETLLPVIREFKLNKTKDTAMIEAQIIVKDTKYKYDNLDLFFQVYDTIRSDGTFYFTPTDSVVFENSDRRTLYFPLDPIAKNPKKYYLLAIIRENVNGVKKEHEPLVREIEIK